MAGNSSNGLGVALTARIRCAGRVGAFLIAATAVGLAAFSANGQPKPATPDGGPIPEPVAGQAETESTSGGMIPAMWEAMRRGAAARGVEVFVVYDGEAFVNAAGGVRSGAAYLGNLRLQLIVDGERLLGWPGATLFLQGLNPRGSPEPFRRRRAGDE